MPEVTRLDVSYNQITKIPSFAGNSRSKITTLLLGNNDLSNLEGKDIARDFSNITQFIIQNMYVI